MFLSLYRLAATSTFKQKNTPYYYRKTLIIDQLTQASARSPTPPEMSLKRGKLRDFLAVTPCGSAGAVPPPAARCPRRVGKISQADQSAAPTEEHHGGNGTRLAQEDTTDTFLSPSNGTHPAGPGPPATDRHILGNVSYSFLLLIVVFQRLAPRMALFYISNNGGYELA